MLASADTTAMPLRNLLVLALAGVGSAWQPAAGKIRGVNLGSLFVVEPWMAADAWSAMGCGGKAGGVRLHARAREGSTFAFGVPYVS